MFNPNMFQTVTDVIRAAPPPPPLADDRITMMLTILGVGVAAATLALGAVSVYLAYLAIVGKREVIKKAEVEAGIVAARVAEEYLEKNETLAALYEQRVTNSASTPIPASKPMSDVGTAAITGHLEEEDPEEDQNDNDVG